MPAEGVASVADLLQYLTGFQIQGFGAFLVVVALLLIGFYIVYSGRLADKPLADVALQVIGLTLFAPLLLILAIADKINSEAVTGLFGTIVGYIFGVASTRTAKPNGQAGEAAAVQDGQKASGGEAGQGEKQT
jgi:drug/metabolite transporter (DMT)-like permease